MVITFRRVIVNPSLTLPLHEWIVCKFREDHTQEIGNSRQWLLDYAMEYTHLIWVEQHIVVKRRVGKRKTWTHVICS
jgi:hypothetical protein